MSTHKPTVSTSMDKVNHLLGQILHLYKALGPESMESLTKSYLAAAPTQGTAKDAAEVMMAEAFEIFDDAADSALTEFARRVGYDLSESRTYLKRRDEGYFRVMYPAIVMYMVWIDREGQTELLKNMGEVFASWMFGTAGYVILDSNLDENKANPTEILLSLSFIQEHERLLLEAIEFGEADYMVLDRIKQLYLAAEITEKRSRFVRSPYTKDSPESCGYKAVHGYLPLLLLLQKAGKADLIDDYLTFFYEWGAPLQIMDDLMDLEEDIENGHYSYPTIGFEEELAKRSPHEVAIAIMSDVDHLRGLYQVCKGLIESSRERSVRLGADLFGYFVTILEARIDAYFSELLKADRTDG